MLLDELLPEYQFNERHRILIHAPPERALEAVKQATPGEMPLVRTLFTVRSLPAILARRQGLPTEKTKPLYEQMPASGFLFLAEGPGREVVGSEIGQMWKPLGGSAPTIRDARQFVAFEEPGYAKVAMNFFVEPADRGTRLTTETRIMTTDAVSRRRFALYWRVIYPGSALIRRSWLRAAKRRAEGAPG
jgi:hypothetical protein